jgi:hypothetical protein
MSRGSDKTNNKGSTAISAVLPVRDDLLLDISVPSGRAQL